MLKTMLSNKSKKTILARKTRFCKTPFSKSVGLMFSRRLEGKALIFIFSREKIIPLHNLFVFYPIDVLFLDNDKKVVEIRENFRPFTFYTPKNKANYVIELPQGAVKQSKTEVDDKIEFQIRKV